MQKDSMYNDRARSEAVLKNRSLLHQGREITLNECGDSYLLMNRMTLENVNIGDLSSYRWFRFRQRSFRTLSVSTNNISANSYVPSSMLQRCRSISVDLCITTAPLNCASKKIFSRTKNVTRSNVLVSIMNQVSNAKFYRKIKNYLRLLSSSCQVFELDFDPFEEAPDAFALSILKGAIQSSPSLKNLGLSTSILNGFDLINQHSKQYASLETLKLTLLSIRRDTVASGYSEEPNRCDNFLEFLARQNQLCKFELYFTDHYDHEFDFKSLFETLGELKALERFKILFNANQVLTVNFMKALLNTKTKFKSLDVCFLYWCWEPSDNEENLAFLFQIFKSNLPAVDRMARVQFTKLKFEQYYDGDKCNLVAFESQTKKERLFPLQFLQLGSQLKELSLSLCITNEEFSDIPVFLSDQLSQQSQLERLSLDLCFNSQYPAIQTIDSILNILSTQLAARLQQLKDFKLSINTCSFKFSPDQKLITQVALGISNLRNLRNLKLYFRTELNGEVSIAPITTSIKQMKNLENLDFPMSLHPIHEQEVESLIASLTNLEHLSTLELDVCPEKLTNQLSDKLPGLINRIRSAEVINLNLKSRNKPLNMKDSQKLLQKLRKNIVHQQTMQSFRVLTTSTQGLYMGLLRNLKFPNNWE